MIGSIADLEFEIECYEGALEVHAAKGSLDSSTAVGIKERLERNRTAVAAIRKLGVPINTVETGVQIEESRRPQGGAKAANQYGTFQVHHASPAQIGFIQRLLLQKDTSSIAIPTDIGPINKKAASDLITQLLGLTDRPTEEARASIPMATDKQIPLIVRESARRVGFEPVTEDQARAMTRRDASTMLDGLFAAPFAPRLVVAATEALAVGVYRVNGDVYRVYPAKADRTRMLAKKLIMDLDEHGHAEHGSWEYAGMASRFVTAADRMTKEQAIEFGRDFEICCVCGALLEDPTSVEKGIGPVCEKKNFAA